jgi:hypothetical protein
MHRFVPNSIGSSRLFPAALFTLLLLFSSTAHGADAPAKAGADTIVFKNGDQLTGKVLSAEGSNVTFHSDVAGDLKIDWSKIKELHTSQQFAVLKTGQKVDKKTPSSDIAQGNISVSDDAIQVKTADGQKSETIPTKSAALVIEETTFTKDLHARPNFFQDWTGSASGGVGTVQATQNSQAFNVGIALARIVPTSSWLAPRNRTTADFTDSYGHVTQPNTAGAGQPSNASSTKTSIYHVDAERDEYLSPRFYVLGDAAFDHNYSQGLNLQQLYGGGVGMTVLKQPKQELDVKIDIHYEKQSFAAGSGTPDQNLAGFGFGETYTRKLPKGFGLNESGLFDFAFNETSAYSSNAAAALVFPSFKRLAFNVGVVDGFINNPPAGFKKNSFQFTTNVTYTFK